LQNKMKNNKSLAKAYYGIVSQRAKSLDKVSIMKKRIVTLEVNLPKYYAMNGSLENSNLKGIGKKTKRILELILNNGAEEAEQITQKTNFKEGKSGSYDFRSDSYTKSIGGMEIDDYSEDSFP